MKKIVIVDIDGTVALKGNRSPYDYENVDKDKPNLPIVELVQYLAEEYTIVFMSGRDDSCREKTKQWLEKWGLSGNLYMRKTGDYRNDAIIKAELFENIKNRQVAFVLDDRDRVVKMWREKGLTCLQVAEGNF